MAERDAFERWYFTVHGPRFRATDAKKAYARSCFEAGARSRDAEVRERYSHGYIDGFNAGLVEADERGAVAERDRLREALRGMVADCDKLHPSTRAGGQVMVYSILPGTLQRARAALGDKTDA